MPTQENRSISDVDQRFSPGSHTAQTFKFKPTTFRTSSPTLGSHENGIENQSMCTEVRFKIEGCKTRLLHYA